MTTKNHTVINFGFRDKWNRQVGLVVSTWSGEWSGKTGSWFRAHASRNGEAYGSSTTYTEECFPSDAERDAALAKFQVSAKKRAFARLVKSGKLHPDDLAGAGEVAP